jgi:hypothetical protein
VQQGRAAGDQLGRQGRRLAAAWAIGRVVFALVRMARRRGAPRGSGWRPRSVVRRPLAVARRERTRLVRHRLPAAVAGARAFVGDSLGLVVWVGLAVGVLYCWYLDDRQRQRVRAAVAAVGRLVAVVARDLRGYREE